MAVSDDSETTAVPDRLQAVLIGFFASAAVLLITTYSVVPTVYTGTVPLDADTLARRPPSLTLFVAAILAAVAMLIVGIARRWRWVFWCVLIACASAVLHLPVTLLQLAGKLSGHPSVWYETVQVCAEAMQVGIAIWMVRVHRRGGVWGA